MRVVIAEDSALMREGLRRLATEAGHTVVGTVTDADQLMTLIDGCAATDGVPDVAVLDIRMPPTHTDEGARGALEVRRRWPGIGILLLSQHIEARYAVRLIRQHPRGFGYLLKDRVVAIEELLDAIQRVGQGGFAVDPEVISQLMSRSGGAVELLTPRENDVLSLLAQGCSNRAIGRQLRLSEKTVENHISSVFAKLGLIEDLDENRRVRAVLVYLQQ